MYMKVYYRLIAGLIIAKAGIVSSQSSFFYPYGNNSGDTQHPPVDDACSITYDRDIQLFGVMYSSIYVCTNGLLSLNGSYTSFTPTSFPLGSGVGIIAPFWADADLQYGGNLWAREIINDTSLLNNISTTISQVYRTGFTATWALVVTWEDVSAYGSVAPNPTNFYQCVVAADDVGKTYVLYLYGDINWTYGSASSNVPAQVGFDSGDGVNYFALSDSQTADIINVTFQSNIGERGRWAFRLDSATIVIPDPSATFPPTTTPQTSTRVVTTTVHRSATTSESITTTKITTTENTVKTTTESSTRPTASSSDHTTSVQGSGGGKESSTTTRTSDNTTLTQGTGEGKESSTTTSTSDNTTSTQGSGAGITEAQGSKMGGNPEKQTTTIAGSVSAVLALLALVALLLLFKRWKKKQQEVENFDIEDGNGKELFGQAPVHHVWPLDVASIITAKPQQLPSDALAQIKTAKTVPKRGLYGKNLVVHKDEIPSAAPFKHEWPEALSKAAVTFASQPLPPASISASGDKSEPNPKIKPLPPLDAKMSKSQHVNAKGSRKQRKVAAKTLKQINNLYGK